MVGGDVLDEVLDVVLSEFLDTDAGCDSVKAAAPMYRPQKDWVDRDAVGRNFERLALAGLALFDFGLVQLVVPQKAHGVSRVERSKDRM